MRAYPHINIYCIHYVCMSLCVCIVRMFEQHAHLLIPCFYICQYVCIYSKRELPLNLSHSCCRYVCMYVCVYVCMYVCEQDSCLCPCVWMFMWGQNICVLGLFFPILCVSLSLAHKQPPPYTLFTYLHTFPRVCSIPCRLWMGGRGALTDSPGFQWLGIGAGSLCCSQPHRRGEISALTAQPCLHIHPLTHTYCS